MTAAKILAVDDEPDFELLLTQRFRRQIRAEEFAFRFAHHGEAALAVLDSEPDIELATRHQHAGHGRADPARASARAALASARNHRFGLRRHGQYPNRDEPRRL